MKIQGRFLKTAIVFKPDFVQTETGYNILPNGNWSVEYDVQFSKTNFATGRHHFERLFTNESQAKDFLAYVNSLYTPYMTVLNTDDDWFISANVHRTWQSVLK